MKVFLGGTCGESNWREELIEKIQGKHEYFNPVVENWTKECQLEEERQKQICDVHLYVITPEMQGVFSIAEAVESTLASESLVIFCVLDSLSNSKSFTEAQLKSLRAVERLLIKYGVTVCRYLDYIPYALDELQILANYYKAMEDN